LILASRRDLKRKLVGALVVAGFAFLALPTFAFANGTIGGTVFEDLNVNGIQDAGDTGLNGVRVYVDSNNSDTFDAGEPFALTAKVTGVDGRYTIASQPTGTPTVREDTLPAGYDCSSASALTIGNPAGCEWSVNTASNVANVNFGNFRRASIAGTKFEDTNANGVKDAGEPAIQGVQIYNDANGNDTLDPGTETTTAQTTDASGNYSFTNLVPGSYSIREVLTGTYVCSLPTAANNCEYNATLTSGQALTARNFGNYRPASISGTKFEDLNAEGVKDAGEPVIPSVTIYNDANGIKTLESGS
jgi:hypothetical protein